MVTIVTRAGKGSALTWTEGDANITNLNSGKLENIVEDLTPQLGGDLDVNNNSIVSTGSSAFNITSNTNQSVNLRSQGTGNVNILALGTGEVNIALPFQVGALQWPATAGTNGFVLSTNGTNTLSWTDTVASATSAGSASTVTLTANNTGAGTYYPLFATAATGNLSPNTDTGLTYNASTGVLTATSFSGSVSGAVSATTLSASSTVSGTGFSTYLASPPAIGGTAAAAVSATTLTFKNPIEAIFNIGTTGGTIAPDPGNGSVQQITLNSALTINAFTNPTAGESITLIIYGGTAYTSITSTMKFAGGIKTLTGTAGCIDILSIYYDGTTYFASLGKGYA